MRSQTSSPMADPGLAMIAYRSHHTEACSEYTGVSNDTVPSFQHAFDLAAMSAYGKALRTLTEVTKSSTFLFPIALVAFHYCIAGKFGEIYLTFGSPNFLLSQFLLFSLFSLACFLLRHFYSRLFFTSITKQEMNIILS